MLKPWKVMALSLLAPLCTDVNALQLRDYDVYADEDYFYPGWYCEECRDPGEYPEDFAAFAYNAYWGEDHWAFGSSLGIPFRVYNSRLQWVVIWFEDFFLDRISLLPNTMEIHIRLETGQVITITVIQGGPDLPINEGSADPDAGSCSCGGDDTDGMDEYDYAEDIDDYEEPDAGSDFVGFVDIVDPDEDGNFPDWIEEL